MEGQREKPQKLNNFVNAHREEIKIQGHGKYIIKLSLIVNVINRTK